MRTFLLFATSRQSETTLQSSNSFLIILSYSPGIIDSTEDKQELPNSVITILAFCLKAFLRWALIFFISYLISSSLEIILFTSVPIPSTIKSGALLASEAVTSNSGASLEAI